MNSRQGLRERERERLRERDRERDREREREQTSKRRRDRKLQVQSENSQPTSTSQALEITFWVLLCNELIQHESRLAVAGKEWDNLRYIRTDRWERLCHIRNHSLALGNKVLTF